jgi:hypothetical protein
MRKFVIAPVFAALAMFVWGFLYWGAPHNLPYRSLGKVSDPAATAEAVGKLFPVSGAYFLPSPLDGEMTMTEMMKRGPSVEVHVRKESLTVMDPAVLVRGYLHMLVVAVLLTVMLCGLEKAFVRWTCRVKFCAFLGLLVAVGDLGAAIWWGHAWGWTIALSAYDFVMYLIAGLVLGKIVTPKTVT